MAKGKGSYTLTSNLDKLNKQIESKLEDALLISSLIVHRQVLDELSGSRTGIEYLIPGTKTSYQASAPGEAPASRTGDLRTDYKAKVSGKGFQAIGHVGSTLPYSVWLEKGTKRMQPRPHLNVAMKKVKKKVVKSFEGLI